MDTLILILLVVGLACFVLAAFGVLGGRVNLIALGLACWITTALLPHLK